MLKAIVASALTASTFAQIMPEIDEPHRNADISSNFVVQTWGGIPFAFPLGVCIADDLVPAYYYKYTCNGDGDEVTISQYEEAGCEGTPADTSTLTADDCVSESWDAPNVYRVGCFQCNNDEEYVEISVSTSETGCGTVGSTAVPSALGVCVYSSNTNYTYNAYCDEEDSFLDYYVFSYGCAVDEAYAFSYSSNADECSELLTFTDADTGVSADLFAQQTVCTASAMTTESPDSASRTMAITAIALSLVSALFIR
jgi:hypothetical protein